MRGCLRAMVEWLNGWILESCISLRPTSHCELRKPGTKNRKVKFHGTEKRKQETGKPISGKPFFLITEPFPRFMVKRQELHFEMFYLETIIYCH